MNAGNGGTTGNGNTGTGTGTPTMTLSANGPTGNNVNTGGTDGGVAGNNGNNGNTNGMQPPANVQHICGNNPSADAVKNYTVTPADEAALKAYRATHGTTIDLTFSNIAGLPVTGDTALHLGGVTVDGATADQLYSMRFVLRAGTMPMPFDTPGFEIYVCIEGQAGALPTISRYVSIDPGTGQITIDVGLPVHLFAENDGARTAPALSGHGTVHEYDVAYHLVAFNGLTQQIGSNVLDIVR
jgi:hypothetical protein